MNQAPQRRELAVCVADDGQPEHAGDELDGVRLKPCGHVPQGNHAVAEVMRAGNAQQ